MLPKISYIYNRKHNRKVEACIYYAGKRRYISTGVAVPEGAVYRSGVISGCPTAPSLNKTLATAMNSLQAQLQQQIERETFEMGAFSLSLRHNTDSFYDWAVDQCNESAIKKSSKEESIKVLTRWKERGIENFADLTPEKIGKTVKAFEKNLRPTTVRIYATILKKYINIALRERIIVDNPMDRVALPKGKSKDICYLTHEELAQVESFEGEGMMKNAVDMFLFACYTGLAYSDLIKIREEDVIYIKKKPYIIDKRKKTGGNYRIRLLPKAMEILKRHAYNLNLMPNNAANFYLLGAEKKMDAELKKKDKKNGFKKHLTMHVGRHTFATLALSSGVRIETVSRMLAHADIKTTQIYAKVLQKDVDEGFDILEGKI